MKIPHQNLHLHSYSMESAKRHIVGVALEAKEKKIITSPRMSFTNHNFMLDPEFMTSFSSRYDIDYVPGFGFKTKEGIELNVYNPGDESLEFLNKLSAEKEFWLLLLMEKLDELGYPIDPTKVLELVKKSELKLLEICDICKYYVEDEYTEIDTETECLIKLVRPVLASGLVPMLRFPFEKSVDELADCEVSLVNPNEFPELVGHISISSVIFCEETRGEIIESCTDKGTQLWYGNGDWI